MTTPWTVPRDWPGETVAILASGPSMAREQAEACRGKCRVIAVNNQGIDTDCEVNGVKTRQPAFAPWADVLFAADLKWWRHYADRSLKFAGLKVMVGHRRNYPEIFSLELSQTVKVFDPRPSHIVSGGNSGYMAMHLAAHFGVKRMLLCGFDMREGPRNRRHWFGNHPGLLNSKARFSGWIHAMDRLAKVFKERHIEVVNCSTNTALRCFKRTSIEDALRGS